MAKYSPHVVLETNWFSGINARQIKQSVLLVWNAGGLSVPTAKVEERGPNAL